MSGDLPFYTGQLLGGWLALLNQQSFQTGDRHSGPGANDPHAQNPGGAPAELSAAAPLQGQNDHALIRAPTVSCALLLWTECCPSQIRMLKS